MDAIQKALRVAKADGGGNVQGSPDPVQTTGTPAFDPNAFVGGLYGDVLGRTGSEQEIQNWVNALNANTMTPEQVRQGFLTSSENQVQDLYSGLLQRGTLDPDAYNWVNALENKSMTPEQIRAGIMASEEYKKLNPTAADTSGGTTTAGTTTGTTAGTTTGTTTGTATAGATPANIGGGGMPLIYTPPPYKDYGATAAAFRVASGLENLPAPFYTLSPVVGGTPSDYNQGTGYSGGATGITPGTGYTGGGTGAGAGAGSGTGTGGKTTYQQVLTQLQGPKIAPTGPKVQPTGPTTQVDTASQRIADIAKLYQQYLGRLPETGAAKNWADAIGRGDLTYAQVLNQIQNSPEATVYGTYKNLLGRDLSNDPGAQQWVNALASGQISREQFEAGVKSSSEYTQNQIAQAYQQYLGRTPSAAELTPWAGAVTSGSMGLGDVINAIRTSDEARGVSGGGGGGAAPAAAQAPAPAVAPAPAAAAPAINAVAAAYEQYLGRSPEPGAAEAWAGAVASGAMSLNDAIAAIATSPEAQSYYTPDYSRKDGGAVKGYADGGGTNYEDLVNAAYRDFLIRDPDPAGFKSWLNALTTGEIAPADFESRFKGAGYEDDIVGAYQSALNRTPTTAEINAWNDALVKGDLTMDQVMQRINKSPEATSQQYYETVPTPDKFSQRQGGRMYDIDIGRVERIPELGRMAAPVNVKQAWENSEIARLQRELDAAKAAGTAQSRDLGGGGGSPGAGSNMGAGDVSGTAGAIQSTSESAGPPAPGSSDSPGEGPGERYGGRINAVDNALRMLKANRH